MRLGLADSRQAYRNCTLEASSILDGMVVFVWKLLGECDVLLCWVII
jgi:hypothetical protein